HASKFQYIRGGHLPEPQHGFARELLENLPNADSDLKDLTRRVLNAMAGAHESDVQQAAKAEVAQRLYGELRELLKDRSVAWRDKL
ncbi:MAG: hypothetical protein JSV90_08645, partial [Methanobacteriota archaeon]